MHARQTNQFKRQAISLACASLLGIGNATAAIHTISASNFSMLDPLGSLVGGSIDVTGSFDDSMICTDVSCTMVNGMTLSSNQTFFGNLWTAHDVRVFGPGTYTFDTTCNAAQIAAGTTVCGGGATLTLVVGPGELGAHMLFDWSASSDIDVIVQWDLNAAFGSPIFDGTTHTGADIWNLVSVDGAGDTNGVTQPDTFRGYKMVDGPFINFNANFNVNMTPPFAFNVAPIANNTAASTSAGVVTNWTPSVSDPDSGPSPLTCSIVSQPATGQGTATVATDCSTGTYDPQTFVGPSTSFTYKANDGAVDSNTATVSVTISANPPPVAGNTTLTAIGVTPEIVDLTPFITDGNGDQDLTTIAISTAATNGSAVSNNNGTVTYTANSGFSGTDSFGYTVDDAAGQTSNEGTIAVTVQSDGPASSTPGYGPGLLAQSVGSTDGSGLTETDVGTDAAMQQQCVGGCNDFIVADPSIGVGTPVTTVIPLSADVPDNAVYRKDNGGWGDFDTSGANAIFSAPPASLLPLVCPEAGSAAYIAGLTGSAGHRCLQLTIVNDGPNDSEAVVPNQVSDPGGIGVPLPPVAPPSNISGPDTGGCTLSTSRNTSAQHVEWWLVTGFLVLLGWRCRKPS
ncbi:MAG: Ig-like domain-containing protein [Gammaproteobacteria bacterium]